MVPRAMLLGGNHREILQDLQETVSGGSRNGNFHAEGDQNDDFRAADDQDGALHEAPVEQPSLGSDESFESDKVAGEDTKDLSYKDSEFPASHYRGSSETHLDPAEDTFEETDLSSKQTADDNPDVQHSKADESSLSSTGSTEMSSEPKKSRKRFRAI